ncbi:hypothetical protein CXG81DRAFT_16742 [Caulochytrium protostelioides]|uniref:IFT81 calponin homology domain-containing protein n=1 Tax=Caulochytrium protostelioides TaxID=1555241 RepID=A0A4P9XF09_9FUNG|nr:hypothetical protein CXG81DRAFT_16742 [Caulochytrium protostelioides]|eukprot:RKP03771.1 hypothetical protein CXG81DRAFT_16742 [Caulochytrium protostelioides]
MASTPSPTDAASPLSPGSGGPSGPATLFPLPPLSTLALKQLAARLRLPPLGYPRVDFLALHENWSTARIADVLERVLARLLVRPTGRPFFGGAGDAADAAGPEGGSDGARADSAGTHDGGGVRDTASPRDLDGHALSNDRSTHGSDDPLLGGGGAGGSLVEALTIALGLTDAPGGMSPLSPAPPAGAAALAGAAASATYGNDAADGAEGAAPSGVMLEAEARAHARAELLRLLRFPPALADSARLTALLLEQDRTTLLNVLAFLLRQPDAHAKRAYLGCFLTAPAVPEPVRQSSPATSQLEAQLSEAQARFRAVHQLAERARAADVAADLRADVQSLEATKQHLQQRVRRLSEEVTSQPGHAAYAAAIAKLRSEIQRGEAAARHEARQRETLQHVVTRRDAVLEQVARQAQALGPAPESGQLDFAKLMASLEAESAELEAKAGPDGLAAVMADRTAERRWLQALASARSASASSGQAAAASAALALPTDPDDIRAQLEATEQHVAAMQTQLTQLRAKSDPTPLFRKQVETLAQKQAALQAQLADLERTAADASDAMDGAGQRPAGASLPLLRAQLAEKQAALTLSERVLRGADLKTYVAQLRAKSGTYKDTKAQLAALDIEGGILDRTAMLVGQRVRDHMGALLRGQATGDGIGLLGGDGPLRPTTAVMASAAEMLQRRQQLYESVRQLLAEHQRQSAQLRPLVKARYAARTRLTALEAARADAQRRLRTMRGGLGSTGRRLDQDLQAARAQLQTHQNRLAAATAREAVLSLWSEKVAQEVRAYAREAREDPHAVAHQRHTRHASGAAASSSSGEPATLREAYTTALRAAEREALRLQDPSAARLPAAAAAGSGMPIAPAEGGAEAPAAPVTYEQGLRQVNMLQSFRRLLEVKLDSHEAQAKSKVTALY